MPELNSIKAFKKAILLDFTIPKSTIEILKIAAKQKKNRDWNNWLYEMTRI